MNGINNSWSQEQNVKKNQKAKQKKPQKQIVQVCQKTLTKSYNDKEKG